MIKKNGFTLVELLAVIAILAILVIITLPNVISMYNEAKQNSFTTEIKEIYRTAQYKWVTESLSETKNVVYSKTESGSCENSIDLSGGKKINYYMELNNDGKVTKFYAENGTYQYSYNGSGLEIEDIEYVIERSKLADNEKLTISCLGVSGEATTGCRLVSGSLNRAGSEVVCGTEHFYVIRVVNNNVRLLAAKNITLSLTNPIQTDVHTPTYFSTTPYWYDEENWSTKSQYINHNTHGLNYVYDSNSNLYQYVEKYAETIEELGVSNVSAELIRIEDIYGVPKNNRRDGIKRSIMIMSQSEYDSLKNQAISLFGTENIDEMIHAYHLDQLWDYNELNNEEKLVYMAAAYNILADMDLLGAGDEAIITAIDEMINDFNTTYYDWLPDWMYDGKDYYSGEGWQTSLAYPWKENWDGGASYNDTTYYGIRPVLIIPTSEIK